MKTKASPPEICERHPLLLLTSTVMKELMFESNEGNTGAILGDLSTFTKAMKALKIKLLKNLDPN